MARSKNLTTEAGKSGTEQKATARRSTARETTRPTTKSVTGNPIRPYTEAEIRERAYFIYLQRAGGPGDALSDWYQAERELRMVHGCGDQ